MMKKLMLTCPACSNVLPDKLIQKFQTEVQLELSKEFEKQKRVLKAEINSGSSALRKLNSDKDKLEINLLLKIKEREEVINDLRNKIEEAKRRADAALSSQRATGEAQELVLESILKETFPQDEILEVPKGTSGGDCVQVIKTSSGAEIAKILYESKSTKSFSESWLEKLRTDNLKTNAQALVLVTKAFPKDANSRFIIRNGVWICAIEDVHQLSIILRYAILKTEAFILAQNKKQTVKEKLFDYLTSAQFRDSFEHILNGFQKLHQTHTAEKAKLALLWKQREQMFAEMLDQAMDFYAQLQGHSGVECFPELQTFELASTR